MDKIIRKSLEADALETDELELRKNDDSDVMISAVQGEVAEMAQEVRLEVEEDVAEVYEEPVKKQAELSPEVLKSCLKGLESDFKKGIVEIDEEKGVSDYRDELESEGAAGSTWETIEERLLANDSTLLKKAAKMQGGGELIGVYPNGELLIKTRGPEPVITAFDAQNNRLTITTDTPNREAVMRDIVENGKFGDYWEIRQAAIDDGYIIPADSLDFEKKGIVAAVEVVSGKPFVRSSNGKEWRSAILDCGNVSRNARVRVVGSYPFIEFAYVITDGPRYRYGARGAVCLLRG